MKVFIYGINHLWSHRYIISSHWLGNVKELTRNTPIIPGALRAVIIAELILLVVIILKSLSIL